MALLLVYGITADIWHYCRYMAILQIYGITADIWHYCRYMALLQIYGITAEIVDQAFVQGYIAKLDCQEKIEKLCGLP